MGAGGYASSTFLPWQEGCRGWDPARVAGLEPGNRPSTSPRGRGGKGPGGWEPQCQSHRGRHPVWPQSPAINSQTPQASDQEEDTQSWAQRGRIVFYLSVCFCRPRSALQTMSLNHSLVIRSAHISASLHFIFSVLVPNDHHLCLLLILFLQKDLSQP